MMETSSPLAAIRPAPPTFGGQKDLFRPRMHHASQSYNTGLGSGNMNFNFGDQFTMPPPRPEYFNLKATVHGSSPTVSLAADLSQNFSITEASPHFPTPRRALFSTTHFMGGMEGREYITTPPLVSSSPGGAMNDSMDISPLPHKPPYFSVSQIELHSPSPAATPSSDENMVDSPAFAPRQTFLEPPKPLIPERKKLGLRRPSLTRTKNYTTSAVLTTRLHRAAEQLPPFRFGGNNDQLPAFRFGGESRLPSSNLSLSECFENSPPQERQERQERRPQSANSPCASVAPIRHRPNFGSMAAMNVARSNGSPASGHVRRPSNNPTINGRPRKQFRRSLSMFENPGDITRPKKELSPALSTLQSVMDVDEAQEPVLPHFFPEGQNDSIPRISRNTMLEVLDGKYGDQFDQKMIIDCRFEYEYDGGHIDGAINYNDKELLSSHLFQTPMNGRTLLIFHCEYSAHRAPIMARHIRAADRCANAEHYPKLTYPEVYILEGGYSGFFSEHRDRCYPQAYVEMDDAEHVQTCEREMGRLKKKKERKGLSRAATFAFGTHTSPSVQDSPTQPARRNSRESPNNSMMMMLGASPILGNDRSSIARRLASY